MYSGFNRGLQTAQGLFPVLGPPEENSVVKLTRRSSSGHSSADCTTRASYNRLVDFKSTLVEDHKHITCCVFIDIRHIINTYIWPSTRVLIAFLRNGAIFIAIKYTNGIFEVVSEFCDRLKLLLHVCCTRQRRKQKAPVCIYHTNRCMYNIVMRFFFLDPAQVFFSHMVIIHYITP